MPESPLPFTVEPAEPSEKFRAGRILAGGRATKNMELKLVPNQPSYLRAQQIANRVNTRFPQAAEDKFALADAKSDSVIELTMPERFKKNPQRLLDLISHLYLESSNAFNQEQARALARVLESPANHQYADDIAYVWEGMGRNIQPLLRELYSHRDPVVRLTALQAGARLGDPTTAEPLFELTKLRSARVQAAGLIADLLIQRPDHGRARRMLRQLLNDSTPGVRMTAFQALSDTRYESVQRWAFSNKLELARVECREPMVWAATGGKPRIVIFDSGLRFKPGTLFSMWDNRFMIKSPADTSGEVDVFYNAANKPSHVYRIHSIRVLRAASRRSLPGGCRWCCRASRRARPRGSRSAS